MAFKYVNPGYSGLFDLISSSKESSASTYNPSNGIAFGTTATYAASTNQCRVTLPTSGSIKEIWVKYDFYSASLNYYYVMMRLNTASYYAHMYSNSSSAVKYTFNSGGNNFDGFTMPLKQVNTIMHHIVSSATAGVLETYLNGTLVNQYTGKNICGGEAFTSVLFSSTQTSDDYYSNVIISDSEISTDERIAIVPALATTSDWTTSGSGYYAASVGKQLLQTLDIDTLKTNISSVIGSGKSAAFKSLALCAKFGTPGSSADAISTIFKNSSASATGETKKLPSRGLYTSALLQNPITNSDWTESDLRNMSVGFESAEV